MIPVEGHKGLYRDENSNAIINCNQNEYEDYMRLKQKITEEKFEVQTLKEQIDELKSLLEKVLDNKA